MPRALLLGLFLLQPIVAQGDPRPAKGTERIVRLTAKRFEYSPAVIDVEAGEPVTLELVSLDRKHGFNVPDLHIRSDIKPGETTRIHLVPNKAGTFPFHCDIFCGSGHEGMEGRIVVHPRGSKP
jgi:cytochrome c oxidase subunit 2